MVGWLVNVAVFVSRINSYKVIAKTKRTVYKVLFLSVILNAKYYFLCVIIPIDDGSVLTETNYVLC